MESMEWIEGMNECIDGWMDGIDGMDGLNEWMDGIDGMDGWTDGLTDGLTDRRRGRV
jgi:hypothetical protein